MTWQRISFEAIVATLLATTDQWWRAALSNKVVTLAPYSFIKIGLWEKPIASSRAEASAEKSEPAEEKGEESASNAASEPEQEVPAAPQSPESETPEPEPEEPATPGTAEAIETPIGRLFVIRFTGSCRALSNLGSDLRRTIRITGPFDLSKLRRESGNRGSSAFNPAASTPPLGSGPFSGYPSNSWFLVVKGSNGEMGRIGLGSEAGESSGRQPLNLPAVNPNGQLPLSQANLGPFDSINRRPRPSFPRNAFSGSPLIRYLMDVTPSLQYRFG